MSCQTSYGNRVANGKGSGGKSAASAPKPSNEPTSSLSARTRIKPLTDEARIANHLYFSSFDDAPCYAITMGVDTILTARACLVLATGGAKSAAVAHMVEGAVSAACPASALQLHPSVTVVLDREAAAGLRFGEYYEHIHRTAAESVFV